MRMRRKPNLDARVEKCRHLLVADPASLRGKWLSEFKYSELRIELGCGKGSFTIETAKTEPEILHVAVEKTANVLVIALERAEHEGIPNIRFINALAENLQNFFASREVARIYLNFSDPWPGNKQAKRRLTSKGFLEAYGQILRHNGEIHFKTDNLPLFEFSLREFERRGFILLAEARDLHKNGPAGVMTDYEQKFFSQGLPIYQCIAQNTERK